MCKVWFSSCPGSESLPLHLQQSEFRGGQSPHHFSPIFHRHPRHLGGVFLWLFYPRLVRSTRLVKSNKMQENMAKNGWERTKVARIGRSPSLYGQKRVEGGVGQSREPKLSVCCLHNSAHPFLARNRPGAPVFGYCPKTNEQFGPDRRTRIILFFFQAEDGIRDPLWSRGLGDVYKRQAPGRFLARNG